MLYLTPHTESMRHFLPLLVVLLAVFATSCTQEYICQCVVKYDGVQPGLPDTSIHEFFIKNKKSEATKQCEANSTSADQNGVMMVETCRLY